MMRGTAVPHLTRFRGDSVPGGRQGDATWNAVAGIPCQVDGRKGHLTRFCRETVARFGKTYALIFILRMGNGLP